MGPGLDDGRHLENWSTGFRSEDSVADILDFLDRNGAAHTIHQRVSTSRELGHYPSRFAAQKTFRVAYLAMHGDRGKVFVGSTPISLETLTWSTLDHEPAHSSSRDDPAPRRSCASTTVAIATRLCAAVSKSCARLRLAMAG